MAIAEILPGWIERKREDKSFLIREKSLKKPEEEEEDDIKNPQEDNILRNYITIFVCLLYSRVLRMETMLRGWTERKREDKSFLIKEKSLEKDIEAPQKIFI